MTKFIVILGPTSSGKSSLAIKLAKKFNGEIISADSRQVYKDLDIGTGKVTKKEQKIVPHHLIDIASPKRQYSVADFKHDVKSAAAQITNKGKVPFLVGGTPFYIYAAVDDLQIPKVKPNLKLRKTLEKKSPTELFKMLKKLDPQRAKTIDRHNPRRLIRALEIIKATGKPVPTLDHPYLTSPIKGEEPVFSFEKRPSSFPPPPDHGRGRLGGGGVIMIGLNPASKKLRKLIAARVEQRFKQGLLKEVKHMLSTGIALKRLKQIGLTYALAADFLARRPGVPKNARSSKKWYSIKKAELIQKIKTAEWQFARRQMTWFNHDQRIHWITSQKQAEKLIKSFLKKY
ncbi:MAG: tRNA (adenosine(37)-N6)-dimethylallyltransferase MiaA [Candidatus Doudnabacteria bacterium]|nr:tRNA (adenosine(37)-N6)-dimethylallyltransferase MiaA [Candidatus Doudnabacteria bacterium]